MTLYESKKIAREKKPLENGKFDRHMRRARENDIASKEMAFVRQSEEAKSKKDDTLKISTSIY